MVGRKPGGLQVSCWRSCAPYKISVLLKSDFCFPVPWLDGVLPSKSIAKNHVFKTAFTNYYYSYRDYSISRSPVKTPLNFLLLGPW